MSTQTEIKKGLGIITFNAEPYFETLFKSIPDKALDEIVVVNGGSKYVKIYKRENGEKLHWIQHEENKGAAQARNDALQKLLELGCDDIFLCEDDMIFQSDKVFEEYINASRITGIEYLCFCSYGWGTGPVGARTPKLKVQYNPQLSLSLYNNMCNEFTYRSKRMLEEVGLYDTTYKYTFDIDWVKRASESNRASPFWYFVDLANSDDLIMNNPDATSRMDSDGNRINRLLPDYQYFHQKHGVMIQQIPDIGKERVIEKLKRIKT